MQLNEADRERFEGMLHRLELTKAWADLSATLADGWMVVPGRRLCGEQLPWRAYPVARDRTKEVQLSHFAGNVLREVTGFVSGVYTVSDVKLAQDKALRMLMVFSPRGQA